LGIVEGDIIYILRILIVWENFRTSV